MSRHAKLGLVLNILGLFFTIVIFVGILAFILYHFGGIEGFMQEYMNIMGVDSMEALYEMLGITY